MENYEYEETRKFKKNLTQAGIGFILTGAATVGSALIVNEESSNLPKEIKEVARHTLDKHSLTYLMEAAKPELKNIYSADISKLTTTIDSLKNTQAYKDNFPLIPSNNASTYSLALVLGLLSFTVYKAMKAVNHDLNAAEIKEQN